MDEIKIGEYIRTKKGKITKITTINNVKYTSWGAKARNKRELIGTKRLLINGRYEIEDITKHSFNIIDLIEVGDYVNGEKVIYIDNLTGSLRQYNVAGENIEEVCGHWQEDIKSIVTHERFKNIEYIIGE